MKTAVILAGGLGTRLRPLTKVIPKPLLPVGDRSVLEVQISQLKKHGIRTIFFATNYKSALMESYFGDGRAFGVDIRYSLEKKKLGTCGPLSLLREELTKPFVVLNGDILSNLDFKKAFAFHKKHKAALTVVTKEISLPLSYGEVLADGPLIKNVKEKPDIRVEVAAGIYLMSPDIFQVIPDNEEFGMDQLIHTMLKAKKPVYRYKMEEYWLDIGRMEDYEKAQEDVGRHFSQD